MRDQKHTPCVSIPREHRDRAGPAYILIHQACLAHTAVAEDDNLFAFALETCSPGPEAVRRGAKSHLEENLLARSHDGRAVGSMMQQLSIRRRRGRAWDRTASTQRAVRSGRPKNGGVSCDRIRQRPITNESLPSWPYQRRGRGRPGCGFERAKRSG